MAATQQIEGLADNWKDRRSGMVCDTCVFFVYKHNSTDGLKTKPIGRCRRHAPTMSGFPVVFPSDWCGDHRLDENKV